MAFGGAAVVGQSSRNIHEITGVTLAGNAGAFDPTGVAADSGLLSTAAAPPAGSVPIPTTFGPGQGKWTAADVAAVAAQFENSAVGANSRGAVGAVSLVGSDLQVGIHSLEVGVLGAIKVRLRAEHSGQR